jgi:hypothetical protein
MFFCRKRLLFFTCLGLPLWTLCTTVSLHIRIYKHIQRKTKIVITNLDKQTNYFELFRRYIFYDITLSFRKGNNQKTVYAEKVNTDVQSP